MPEDLMELCQGRC